MKIAVVTDDESTISKHFGRAPFYLVFTIREGEIVEKERRDKPGHQQFAREHHQQHMHEHGLDTDSAAKHALMLEPIRDCDAVIVGGMGTGAYRSVEQAHIRAFVTDVEDAEVAVRAYIDGTLIDHPEWLH